MKLKVGDRVIFAGATVGGSIFYVPHKSTVIDVNPIPTAKEMIEIKADNDNLNVVVHEMQCRRLIKKPRRRVWIAEAYIGSPDFAVKYTDPNIQNGLDWVEFVEIRKKVKS